MNITLSTDNNFLLELNGTATWVPRLNGVPDLSRLSEPYKTNAQAALTTWLAAGNVIPLPIAPPIVLQPDWEGLLNSLFVGDLAPIFQDVTMVAANSTNNALVLARGDIFGAITSVKQEIALAAALSLLVSSGYSVSSKNKTLWNNTVTSFNFSPLVFL